MKQLLPELVKNPTTDFQHNTKPILVLLKGRSLMAWKKSPAAHKCVGVHKKIAGNIDI